MPRILSSLRSSRSAGSLIPAIALVILGAGCSTITQPERDLQNAERRWATTAPAAYQVTVSRSCECMPETTRPVIVSVRDGVVESRRYADTGLEVPALYAPFYPTVEGQFDIIESAIARNAAEVSATYDADRGIPLSVFIDYDARMVDDETGFLMRDFIVR